MESSIQTVELPNLPVKAGITLTEVVTRLCKKLGDNLYSCILYGSAVRGSFNPQNSDLNVLIILNESTPDAHREISRILNTKIRIEPFVISRIGMERSFEAFAIKFCSIQRHYRVLFGEDPLHDLVIDERILNFLTEQSLRNLRLRVVRAYIHLSSERKRYIDYINQIMPQVFTDIGTAFRVRGFPVMEGFSERIPLVREQLGDAANVLEDLLALKGRKMALSDRDIFRLHEKLFTLLDRTVTWLSK
jgi:predicted nucleotidyltransferase